MKKSLLALAVLASFAGAASAQSSVTVYGVVDAGFVRETGGAAGSVSKIDSGMQSGNRLGFKGTEDLGNGLKAIFRIESGFTLDDGQSAQGKTLFGRQAMVGLSGNFGTVALGRQDDPLFTTLDSIDPFGTGLAGQSTNLMAVGNVRTNNSVTYASPNLNGFTANVLYGAGENAADSAADRTVGFSGNYANGPLTVAVAYNKINDTVGSSDAAKMTLVGGTYNFGPATAHIAYETEKADGVSFRDVLVGVSAPVSAAGTVMASYIKKTDKIANSNGGAKQFGIGYSHALSKRTNVYASYAHISNDADAGFAVGNASNNGSAPDAGKSSTAYGVGIRHSF